MQQTYDNAFLQKLSEHVLECEVAMDPSARHESRFDPAEALIRNTDLLETISDKRFAANILKGYPLNQKQVIESLTNIDTFLKSLIPPRKRPAP